MNNYPTFFTHVVRLVLAALLLSASGAMANTTPHQGVPLKLLPQPSQQGGPASPSAPANDILQQEIRDIAGPIQLPKDNTNLILIILASLLGLAILLYLFLRWKKNKKEPQKTPAEIALMQMQHAKNLMEEGLRESYAERITEILRQFITSHFAISATSKTTREFLNHIQKSETTVIFEYKDQLGQCLEQVDLIKFAKYTPEHNTVIDIEHSVTTFIETIAAEKEEK